MQQAVGKPTSGNSSMGCSCTPLGLATFCMRCLTLEATPTYCVRPETLHELIDAGL